MYTASCTFKACFRLAAVPWREERGGGGGRGQETVFFADSLCDVCRCCLGLGLGWKEEREGACRAYTAARPHMVLRRGHPIVSGEKPGVSVFMCRGACRLFDLGVHVWARLAARPGNQATRGSGLRRTAFGLFWGRRSTVFRAGVQPG